MAQDPKQMCLDLSQAALALFDELDAKGDTAPIEDVVTLAKLNNVVHNTDALMEYYRRRAAQRILAMGLNPAEIFKRIGSGG